MKRLATMSRAATRRHWVAGKRVLITGGSSGIGLACARELTARGARVVLLARGDESLEDAAASLEGSAEVVGADVSDAEAMRRALTDAAQALGGGADAVIANANAVYGPFADMSPEDYRRTIEITLLGMINTAHAALPHLEATSGTLVVVGSISGRLPTPWLSVYAAAKHGVRGFVRTLQIELRALGSSVRALASAATERTVGALMASWALLDAIAPNTALRVVGRLAKLGWRMREKRPVNHSDSLTQPLTRARQRIGFRTRPSVLVKLRDLRQGSLDALQTRRRGADRHAPTAQRPREDRRSQAALDVLHARVFNYDAAHPDQLTAAAGWRHETRCQALPREDPGPPVPGGSWQTARDLMRDYEFADPSMVAPRAGLQLHGDRRSRTYKRNDDE